VTARSRLLVLSAAVLLPATLASRARAQAPAPSPPPAVPVLDAEPEPINDSEGYTPPTEGSGAPSALSINGYVDVGFAHAQGDGTSFAPGDTRVPLDYGVDTFAPAVNSRGDVASTDPGPGRTLNGFLPRSAGIGGRPSFLLNTLSVDLKYTAPGAPLMVFSRVAFLPRYFGVDGDGTRVVVEQAFGRLVPFESQELALSVGKFDSVFGIEYLENQANFRIGITPSLLARYTTGTSTGVKVFYRFQLIAISSAVSINASATNSGTFVEALQGPSRSLTGVPVATARLGYELNLARLSVKLGASAERGPRNDQNDRGVMQLLYGFDLRVFVAGLTLMGEFVKVDEEEGNPNKLTGTGTYTFTSDFYARGFWVQAAYELPLPIAPFRITPYARYEQRHGEFVGFASIAVDRFTGGVNVGVGENLIVKGEYLVNREVEGAPTVPNNVFTSSVVWTW